jgi:hypothetical protein
VSASDEMRAVGAAFAKQLEGGGATANGWRIRIPEAEHEQLGRLAVSSLLSAGWRCYTSEGDFAMLSEAKP